MTKNKKSIIGKADNKNILIDLPNLLKTRLLVQANSGGGKSYLLRRLLEQTAKDVQQIVLDVEGSFYTLREKFDYVICSPSGGDAIATPRTAALLARKLMETGASAIVDISELKAHERKTFVRLFCESLIELPKKLWHPALIVIDEIHLFAPEKGQAESAASVIDIATRGRIRGLCLVGATQRLAKLSKDVAAELNNKLIGRTGLDVDVKRAAEELGLTAKEAMPILRNMGEGEFFCFGSALTLSIKRIIVGKVITTHPDAGSGVLPKPPAPSKKIKSILNELEDLPQEAEKEAKTLSEFKAEVLTLKRQLSSAEKKLKVNGIPESEVLKRERSSAVIAVQNYKQNNTNNPVTDTKNNHHIKALESIKKTVDKILNAQPPKQTNNKASIIQSAFDNSELKLRSGAIKILKELAARNPAGYSKSQVGALTGYSVKGGTFGTYMSDLRRNGLIEERNGLIHATDNGIIYLGNDIPIAPKTHIEMMQQWNKALRSGAYKMLEVIVSSNKQGISREDLSIQVNMTSSGGTFGTYLSDLKRNGLITVQNQNLTANDILFPDN